MKCEFNDRDAFIEKYLRKELSEEDRILFEKHFFSCEECLSELESAQDMMELVRDEGEVLFPEHSARAEPAKEKQSGFISLFNKIFPPKWNLRPSLVYTVIAVLLIILGLYLLTPSMDETISNDEQITGSDNDNTQVPDEEPVSPDKPDSESETDQNELYAANFAESEDLEYLIDQQVRGSEDFTLVSPEMGITVSKEIYFKWLSGTKEQLDLVILNNREEVLFKFTLTDNELIFDAADNELEPGLYYWKLESENELFYIGKFLIADGEK